MNKTQDGNIGPCVIRLRFLPWDGPATEAQRLRHALKLLLRSYGIRNEGIVPDVPSVLPPVPIELDPARTEPPFVAKVLPSRPDEPSATDATGQVN